jgi:hypothetical protein
MDKARIGTYFYRLYDNQRPFGNRFIGQSLKCDARYTAKSSETKR